MSGPSERAMKHACKPYGITAEGRVRRAHDAELGLDRSVCLRDVVEFLRKAGVDTSTLAPVADLIEGEFGG